MELTRERAIREHRKMWHWIAEETERRQEKVLKEEYFNMFFQTEDIANNCFCCEYGSQFRNICSHCPIVWGCAKKDSICIVSSSPYIKWCLSTGWQDAAKYARQIAELPEREV